MNERCYTDSIRNIKILNAFCAQRRERLHKVMQKEGGEHEQSSKEQKIKSNVKVTLMSACNKRNNPRSFCFLPKPTQARAMRTETADENSVVYLHYDDNRMRQSKLRSVNIKTREMG